MSKITESARMESCTLRLPGVCRNDRETTVWAHENVLPGGKALGKKLARVDHRGAYACYVCHMILDGQARRPHGMTQEFVLRRFAAAMAESAELLKAKGLWPTDEFLARKPVRAAKPIRKVVTSLEERSTRDAARKPRPPSRRQPVSATAPARKREWPSRAIESANRWPTGRKLESANRLASRPLCGRAAERGTAK
ncbi:DUF1364 domain-containing protein [Burkholderia arboris]|uniref:nuclease domain-containing protein n=1 Tax=Burkholderia arboris TaxID=488730 RepID=UPI001CF193E1|nr:nuclease domain-containing protein [Burkholderia arboris]MCA8037094.1 DUF1364 domain-containing protein [Burkholderia arboris]